MSERDFPISRSNEKKDQKEADAVACPRCGRKYDQDEWSGECQHCGYPEVYFDSFLY